MLFYLQDRGEEFLYTGSGGRDLSGNKRTAEQTCDQILTRMNKALARNCAAPLSEKGRVTAKDWKAGKPVRVVSQIYIHFVILSYPRLKPFCNL